MIKNIDIILRGFFENDGVKKFFRDNAVRMATEIEVKKDAPNIINRLHEEGHEIYFITARSICHLSALITINLICST